MKKLLLLLMFPVLLLLSGCEDKVNSKTLNGMWVVYDGAPAYMIGAQLTFLKEGRLIMQDSWKSSTVVRLYETSDNELRCYFIKNKVKGNLETSFIASLDNNTLSLQGQGAEDSSKWLKLKKQEDLP